MESDAADAISKILKDYPTLTLINNGTKVKCTLTGHEMPMKPQIVLAYAGSKRYHCLLEWNNSPYYQQYKQFLVDCSSKERNLVMKTTNLCSRTQAYCTLTKSFVNRTHRHLETHVTGYKFKEAYAEWLRNHKDDEPSASQSESAQQPVSTDRNVPSATLTDSRPPPGGAHEEVLDDDDDDADSDNKITQQSDEADKQLPSDGNSHEAKDDDDSDDSYSDLYPEGDFLPMDTGESPADKQAESGKATKRHTHKKPKVLKDLKMKKQKTENA